MIFSNRRLGMAGLLAVLVGLAGTTAAASPPVGFRIAPSQEHRTYLQARELAHRLVLDATPRLRRDEARLARRVADALRHARFLASSDRRSQQLCRARQYSLFVNAFRPDTIFICDEVRVHARDPGPDAITRIAQGFIHEAVHLSGEMDECIATRFERTVMQRTIGVRSEGSRIAYGPLCAGRW